MTRSIAVSLPIEVPTADENATAVEAVFDRCSRGLYRYILVRAGGDTHLADDLMQQLWIKASRQGKGIPGDELEYWLRCVAKNLVRTHWRTLSQRPTHVPIADPALARELSERFVSEALPEDVLDRREVRDQLLLAVTALPNEEQELIFGHYFRDRSHAELASKLGISERAVEGRLYRARRSLREALDEFDT